MKKRFYTPSGKQLTKAYINGWIVDHYLEGLRFEIKILLNEIHVSVYQEDKDFVFYIDPETLNQYKCKITQLLNNDELDLFDIKGNLLEYR